jgi:hypothetical protein
VEHPLGNGGTTGTLNPSSAIVDNNTSAGGNVTIPATFAIDPSNTVTQGTDFSGNAITRTGSLANSGSAPCRREGGTRNSLGLTSRKSGIRSF